MTNFVTPQKSNDRLRSMDRMIREVLWQYPDAPRPVYDPWYPMRNRVFMMGIVSSVVFVVVFVYILPGLITEVQTGDIWRSRYVAAVFSPFLIAYFLYLTFHPLYDWLVGIHRGRRTVAVVQRIIERPSLTGVRGIWEIYVDDQWITQKFRQYTTEQQTWIQDLREGDRVQVLVHPTKPRVLLAFGP